MWLDSDQFTMKQFNGAYNFLINLLLVREWGKLLYGRRFPPKLKVTVYKSYVRTAKLHGSEAWCLKESEMGIL